jgi:hypothetical protein
MLATMNMKMAMVGLLTGLLCLASCRPVQQVQLASDTKAVSSRKGLSILPWPDGNVPGGFISGLQLVSLPPDQGKTIVEGAKPTEVPQEKPDFKTPLAAAQYFGTHLNMGGPPKFMAVYADPTGAKSYLFSGGMHWKKEPAFSEAAVLLETGEIRFYKGVANQ